MKNSSTLYPSSLSLLTDLYQLSMAKGYWKSGIYNKESIFHLYFRKVPFHAYYAISSGLELALDYLENLKFDPKEIQYLGNLKGNDGKSIFDESILNYLQRFKFECDVYAIPEGTAIQANSPIIRVEGPLIQAQLIESTLLNIINYSTNIATKAAIIKSVAKEDACFEFGLRRANGPDGALSASRAAYIGGFDGTSNVQAGFIYGIPVRGTHAHSWVMSHDSELQSFKSFADIMPNNCTLLIDTYETKLGIKNAIEIGLQMKAKGQHLQGVRLDSGDLYDLSNYVRRALDAAGLSETKILATNDLDENVIENLKKRGAKIDLWGVGTRLVAVSESLSGVYKLSALKNGDKWESKLKKSDDHSKISWPGKLQIKREIIDNVMYDTLFSEFDHESDIKGKDLLVKVMDKGKRIFESPSIHQIRQQVLDFILSIPIKKEHSWAIDNRLSDLRNDLYGE